MNIVFLDFDGVMATSAYCSCLERQGLPASDSYGRPNFDPECIRNLKLIVDNTNADIVVTSDWKYIDSYKDLLDMWNERNMPGFLTDVTPNVSNHRGDEIDQWLRDCKTDCNYVIIDDLDETAFNAHQLERLIRVESSKGLSKDDATKAIRFLKNEVNQSVG